MFWRGVYYKKIWSHRVSSFFPPRLLVNDKYRWQRVHEAVKSRSVQNKGKGGAASCRLDAWAESTLSQSRQIFPSWGKATRRAVCSGDNAIALPESDTHLLHRYISQSERLLLRADWNNVAGSRSCGLCALSGPDWKAHIPTREMCTQRRFLIAPADAAAAADES
jgi:hypothetical protein